MFTLSQILLDIVIEVIRDTQQNADQNSVNPAHGLTDTKYEL